MRLVIVFLLTCSAVGTSSHHTCDGCRPVTLSTRIKRAKYYSSPPQRFYKRPPMSYPTHGAFSYTPPPSYMMVDEAQQPPNHRPPKYKRPSNDGLGDEDLHNLIKYLSKKDLDKIVDIAVEKDKYKKGYSDKTLDYPKPDYSNDESNFQVIENGNRFSLNGPYMKPNDDYKQRNTEYENFNGNYVPESRPIIVPDGSQNTPSKLYFSTPLENDEVKQKQFAVVDAYIQQNINKMLDDNGQNIFTDSKNTKEEDLPAPVNLRYQDYDASFTNNVPSVVKAESSSYQVENFGNLPLMNYNSNLNSVSSYNVPHYTVTSPTKYQPSPELSPPLSRSPPASGDDTPPLEPAPSVTNYRDQSDAHLKATKIWTHKSRGTAYTLHQDGSLSLERPLQPKPKYG